MAEPHYTVKEAKDGQWYVALVAANGEPLMTGETYTREADAKRAVRTIRAATLQEAAVWEAQAE